MNIQKRLLILGGYGNTGFLIARFLLQESDVQLVLAGRNLNRAQQVADQLNHQFSGDRVSAQQLDASHLKSLEAGFEAIDMVVVASSTIHYTRNIVTTALKVGIDYLDVQLSSPDKLAVLNALQEDIKQQARCFITDGGVHAGIPATMVRYVSTQFDSLEVANISAAFQLNWKELPFSDATTAEFIDELMNFNPLVLKEKQWIKQSFNESLRVDFGQPFGQRYCLPMFLEELRSLPNTIPSLTEVGFYISGFNGMTDYIIMPIAFAALKIFQQRAQKPMNKLFRWGLTEFSHPPFGAIIQLEARGVKDKQPTSMRLRLTHDNAYVLTAISAVACLLQYLNGSIRCSGMWFQSHLVEPQPFFEDIKRLGVDIKCQTTGCI